MWFFHKQKIDKSLIDEIKNEEVDMQTLFSNINNRAKVETLYKQLAKQVHPDRYENNPEKQAIAYHLFSQLQNHKSDYDFMLKLKEEIETKLLND